MNANTEIKFSFLSRTSAWAFMREVDAERAGQAGFPSLEGPYLVRVIPAHPAQVVRIAQEHGGVEIS